MIRIISVTMFLFLTQSDVTEPPRASCGEGEFEGRRRCYGRAFRWPRFKNQDESARRIRSAMAREFVEHVDGLTDPGIDRRLDVVVTILLGMPKAATGRQAARICHLADSQLSQAFPSTSSAPKSIAAQQVFRRYDFVCKPRSP